MYTPSRKAAQLLGVHANTLRKWADANKIKTIRNPAGQRLYNIQSFIKGQSDDEVISLYESKKFAEIALYEVPVGVHKLKEFGKRVFAEYNLPIYDIEYSSELGIISKTNNSAMYF